MNSTNNQNHRFYKQKIPNINELVIVKVINITDNIIETELQEYNNLGATLFLSEVSRKIIKSKKIKKGNLECVRVIEINPEKNYINLSKHNISSQEESRCIKNYKQHKLLFSIVSRVSTVTNININFFYENILWKNPNIYKLIIKKDFTFLDNLFTSNNNSNNDLNNFETIKKNFIEVCNKKITENNYEIKSIIEINCFTFEGIDAIKKALQAGEKYHPNIKIRLITSPQFEIITINNIKNEGIEIVSNALKEIEKTILSLNGEFRIVQEPIIINKIRENENEINEEDDEDDEDDKEEDDEDDEEEEYRK